MIHPFRDIGSKIKALKWLARGNLLPLLSGYDKWYIPALFGQELQAMDGLPGKISLLKNGMDSESCRTVDTFIDRLSIFRFAENIDGVIFRFRPSKAEQETTDAFIRERASLKWKFSKRASIEKKIFYYHHGLRFAPQAVKDYVRGKVFIDAGAYTGESSLALLGYGPSKIYAFEISSANAKDYRQCMRMNGIGPEKCELVQKAAGAVDASMKFLDSGHPGTTLEKSGTDTCEVIRLDSFMKQKAGKTGFLKADVEGAGLDLVKGMTETLKKDRPVLDISVYHTPEELFGIKPYIESLGLDYTFELKHLDDEFFSEFELLAYPAELQDAGK